jgi:GNAT superfamily N-acetyltransferase
MSIAFHRRTHQAAGEAVLSTAYADLYEAVYAEPPYNASPPYTRKEFTQRTTGQVTRPGFELMSLEDGHILVGFCFGFTMQPGRWWGGENDPPPPKEIVEAPKLAVIELIVSKQYRGRGLGKKLLGGLLAERAEPYATLASHPDAPAHDLYVRWGWRIACTSRPPVPGAPLMDIMVYELRKLHAA